MTPNPTRRALAAASALLVVGALAACSAGSDAAVDENPDYRSEPSDAFPVTVEHALGSTEITAEPQRVVVVGITEQDVLLELGVTPVATTEWYNEEPYATWPWAADLLGDAQPEVLGTSDGFEYERIAALEPDLIIGTNAGIDEESYERLSAIAPTVAHPEGEESYFGDWAEQTRLIADAVGRSAEGEALVEGVETAYAEAAAEHPEFAGLSATFAQGGAWDGVLWVYPDGVNTDFLTDLGFVITPGLEQYVIDGEQQAQISAENTSALEADVVLFATEEPDAIDPLLEFGTLATLPAVAEQRAVYTDGELAGAIYFLTPLSQKHVLEQLLPRLEAAVAGEAPRDVEG